MGPGLTPKQGKGWVALLRPRVSDQKEQQSSNCSAGPGWRGMWPLVQAPITSPETENNRIPGHQNCVITQCISIFFLCIIPIPFFVLSNYIKRASLVTKTISPLGFRSHLSCRDLIHYLLSYVFNTAPRCSHPVNHLNTSTFPTWGETNPSLKPFPCPAIKANILRNDYISLPPIHPFRWVPTSILETALQKVAYTSPCF